ncbi:MAG: hypothetical protein SynsKO_11610 [Synoicihabitans sp.]
MDCIVTGMLQFCVMNVTRFLPYLFGFGLLFTLSGCNSTQHRIKQHEDLFTLMPPQTQQRIIEGNVILGDSPEVVYMAFGKPTREDSITTARGKSRTVWTWVKKELHKEDTSIASVNQGSRTMTVEEIYRVVEHLQREVTFLDDRVVHVRNPAGQSRANVAMSTY